MALDFDGTNDRIDWANVFVTKDVATTVSVWAWFDDTIAPTDHVAFWNSGPSDGDFGTVFGQSAGANGQLVVARNGASSMFQLTAADSVTTGVWTHCLWTSDGTGLAAGQHVYVNGSEVSISGSEGIIQNAANSTWSVGGRLLDDNRNFDGRLAEMGVWNRVLGAGEIAVLAARFAPVFVPNGLRFWCTLAGRGTEINRFGAVSTTTVGTAYTDHPRIIYPDRGRQFLPSVPGVRTSRVLSQYRRRRVYA